MLGLVGQNLLEPLVERLLHVLWGEVEADSVLPTQQRMCDAKVRQLELDDRAPVLFESKYKIDLISPACRSYPGRVFPVCRASSVS